MRIYEFYAYKFYIISVVACAGSFVRVPDEALLGTGGGLKTPEQCDGSCGDEPTSLSHQDYNNFAW